MIEIITKLQKHLLDTKYKDYKLIKYPETQFLDVSSILYKKGEGVEVGRILEEVEGCGYISRGNMMESKFNGVPLQLSCMSTGSKIITCIYYMAETGKAKDKIFDITECGNNAINYVLKHYSKYDLKLYLGHNCVYGDTEDEFIVDRRKTNDLSSIFKEHADED